MSGRSRTGRGRTAASRRQAGRQDSEAEATTSRAGPSSEEIAGGDEVAEETDTPPFKPMFSSLTFDKLEAWAREVTIPLGCRANVPAGTDQAAYPPTGFIAISREHMELGFRFPIPGYLRDLLNNLKLAPFQLTPNSYAHLTTLAAAFRKYGLGFPTPRIIRSLYSFKAITGKEGLYYATPRQSSDYRAFLPQRCTKSNVGEYKSNWAWFTCPSIAGLNNTSFVEEPSRDMSTQNNISSTIHMCKHA